MKKKIIIATLTLLFVLLMLPFSSRLSCGQGISQIEIDKIDNSPTIEEKKPDYIIMQASAYTKSHEEQTYKGITKSGTKVCRGVVSVDLRVIPLGTKLYIENYGEAIALDCGGAIKGNRIDLYMDTKKEAMEFGRNNLKVWILK